MTYTEILNEVLARCNLNSPDATTRVGQAINRHYRRISSLLGMETVRFQDVSFPLSLGTVVQQIPGLEKIDRVLAGTERVLLTEVSLHQIRLMTRRADGPSAWAMAHTGYNSTTIHLDFIAQTPYTIVVDGWGALSDLSGTMQPGFPASFHDILTWYAMSEELLRKEKGQLALAYEQKADALLNDLRFHLADTHTRTLQQGSHPGAGVGGGVGGGTGGSTSNFVDVSGSPALNQVALFADADTIKGVPAVAVEPSAVCLTLTGTTSAYTELSTTTAAANGRVLRLINYLGELYLQSVSDAGAVIATPMHVNRSGDMDVGRHLYVLGGQIVFPTTQLPSTSGNVLDDYQEKPYTPSLVGATGQSGQVHTTQQGYYIKVGRLVHVFATVTMSLLGTITGTPGLSLPFQSSSEGVLAVGYFNGTTALSMMSGVVRLNTSRVEFWGIAGGGGSSMTPLTAGNLANNFAVYLSGTYTAVN